MTDLCHGAKVVPNGEKYKNRFDMKKGCQTRCSGRISDAAAAIETTHSKAKKRRDPLRSQRFGTPERIRTAGLPLRSRPDTTSGSGI